ncbi:ketohexokinase-like [Schistocerca piceifrons]|uniref:ketohexokinase-like n=1 Tax=Schistocerca piceifrons TaxID=274613 RepID=UPI001F5F6A79|nr:ketohexokinase-like [Schistocerca piceifrons]
MAVSDKRILCVGVICFDELLYCENYPVEDSVEMVVTRQLRPGGNAANNCAVLGELGVQCDLFGTLNNNSRSGSFVTEQLESYGVNLKQCEIVEGKELPMSTCIINKRNGSRTILHHSGDWPWVSYEAFLKIDLSQATLVVPWGEQGAAAKSPEGVFFVPAYPPERVLDTLGAGDTFCAALLSALSGGHPLQHSLHYACQVAGAKVGMHGYRGLQGVLRERGVRCQH